MTNRERIIKEVEKLIAKGVNNFVIYPFGYQGRLTQQILREYFGICEICIIDNNNEAEGIYKLNHLCSLNGEYRVLLVSDHLGLYKELRSGLYAVVEKDKVVDVFCEEIELQQKKKKQNLLSARKSIMDAMEKMYSEDALYWPSNTKSKFYLPLCPSDLIQRNIYLSNDYFERENLDYVFRKFRTGIIGSKLKEGIALDIGANIGNHTLYMTNECEAKKVYAFEPMDITYFTLEKNIEANGLHERVILYNCGLSNKTECKEVPEVDLLNTGSTSFEKSQNDEDGIAMRMLDDFVFEEPIVFIKIDVEGMELNVLQGAIDLIRNNKPFILLESFPAKFELVKKFLVSEGYSYEAVGDDSDYIFYCE